MIVFFKRFVVSVFLVQVFLVACFGQNVQIAFDGLGDGSLSELKDDYQELIDPLVEALEFSTQEYLTVFDVSLANGYQFTSIELGSEEIHKQHLSLYDPTFTGLAVTYTYDRITARYEVFGSLLLSEDTNECIANNLINSTLLSPQSQEDYKLLMGDFQLDVEKVLDIIQRALCCLDQRSQLGNKLTRQEQRQALICEGVDFNLYFILMQKLMQSEEWKSMIITVDSLKEVLAPCIESEWKPYHEPGVIPKCFYSVDGVSVLPTAPIASGLNSASFVGVLDELGAEVIGLINLPKFAMTTADYVRMYISAWTTFYLSCEEYSYNEPTLNLVFHDLIDSLEIQDPSFNTIYQSHFTVDPGTLSMTGTLAKLVIPTLIIPTSQADCDTLGKIRTSVREILSFDSDIIEMSLIVDSIFSSVIDSTIAPFNLDSTNSFESSYWTGRYMIRTALIFEAGYTITRGGIKLVNKYLRRNSSTIASKTRAISQATRAEHAADLLEEIEKANGIVINPSARKQLISAIASNPRISDFIILKRAKGVKAWERLSFAPSAISGNVNLLEDVTTWPAGWRIQSGAVNGTIEVLDQAGTPLARIFPDRVVASGRSVIGQPGNKILNRVPPIKKMTYEVDGISYLTDEAGRVYKVSGDLDDAVRVRLSNQQIKAVDVKDGIRGTDQGGHAIAARFFGAGEQINYWPQSANLNNGAWKQMENL